MAAGLWPRRLLALHWNRCASPPRTGIMSSSVISSSLAGFERLAHYPRPQVIYRLIMSTKSFPRPTGLASPSRIEPEVRCHEKEKELPVPKRRSLCVEQYAVRNFTSVREKSRIKCLLRAERRKASGSACQTPKSLNCGQKQSVGNHRPNSAQGHRAVVTTT